MASATSSEFCDSSLSALAAAAMPFLIFCIGNFRPLRPVEQTRKGKLIPVSCWAMVDISLASIIPCSAVAALALPLLTTMPATFAEGEVSISLQIRTGAAQTSFKVKPRRHDTVLQRQRVQGRAIRGHPFPGCHKPLQQF